LAGSAAALAIAAAIVVLAASPASAHASLIGTSPVNGVTLDEPPAEIRLRFNERVTVRSGSVILRNASGAVIATEPPRVAAGDPATVVLPVPTDLPDGGYVVSFRVSSADSHPVTGAFVFGVGAPPASVAAADGSIGSGAVGTAFVVGRWLGYAGLALLAGALAVFVLCWPAGWVNRRARRLVTAGWAASLISAMAVLFLQGPYSAGESLVDAVDPDLLAATVSTDFGTSVLLRLGLVAAAGGLILGGLRLRTGVRDAVALAICLAMPATWIRTGHANASGSVADAAADLAHLVAMTTWFGGLVVLAVCLLPRSVSIRDSDEAGRALRRFSLVATCAVGTLVVTGVYVGWRRVGSLDALVGTEYGRLLALKLAAVAALLWLGAVSRAVVRRRFAPSAAVPLQPDGAGRSRRRAVRSAVERDREARTELGRSVRIEVGMAVAVLAVTSVLVATPPGVAVRTAQAQANPPSAPVLDSAELGPEGAVRVLVDPARVGSNRVVVEVLDRIGEPWDVPEVRASFILAGGDLGPLPVSLTRSAAGTYQATGALPFAGDWALSVTVRTSEIDSSTVRIAVPVR
jgi:copper transport protein